MIQETLGTAALPAVEESPLALLRSRIGEGSATIGVIGLGYVGLPLAVEFATHQGRVVAFDMNPDRVSCINAGTSHIGDVPSDAIVRLLEQGRLNATLDFDALSQCDAIVLCVPTPLEKTKDPDLSYIKDAAQAIARNLRPGQMVVLESTTYPGTTEELLLPLFEAGGLKLDEDFLLAFSPERIDPGSTYALRDIPKVVGGCGELSTEVACELYATIVVSVHPVSSARVAETVKLLENTFRLVNIGLINEFALLCNHLAIDSNEVINAAATKPFGYMPFFPGPGAGGHCIPLDPLYLSWRAEQQGFISRFIELADKVNTQMPVYVVDLVAQALNDQAKAMRDSSMLVVGVAYKEDIDDTRQSPAIGVIDRLRARGALVAYHDPHVPILDFDLHDWPEWRPRVELEEDRRALRVANQQAFSRRRRYDMLESVELCPEVLEAADCVLILTKHGGVDYEMIAQHAKVVVDTRHAITEAMRKRGKAEIVRL
ncbi:MAG: nucleotide sugar dehydrogenase [Vulcanimicrobiaceae bacterium]